MSHMQLTLKLLLLALAVVIAFPRICAAGGILHVFPPRFQDESIAVARPVVLISKTTITVSGIAYRISDRSNIP